MPCCDTGRNIQKYKGAAASTLQDVTDNGNTTTGDIITTSGYFIGDGSKLTNVPGVSGAAFTLQQTTNKGNVTTDTVEFQNSITSLTASGNVLVTGNVTASVFYGDGGLLSNTATTPTLQTVTTIGNTTTNTIDFQNSVTSLTTSGNVLVTGNVTASKFYGDGTTLNGVALSTDLASNSSRISTLSTDLASNSSRISTISTDLASNSTRISTLSTDLASNSTRISTLSTDLASNSTRINKLTTDLSSNSSRISTISTDLASNSTRINKLTTDLASNSSRISTLSTDLASNSSRINKLTTDLASNSTRISTISTDLASNSTRINKLTTDLASNSTRISTISTDLASNSTRINKLTTDLSSNSSRINTLENEIQPINRGGTNITTYTKGDILIASATNTLSKLSLGTGGYVLTSNTTTSLPEWKSSSDLGTQVAQLSNSSYILGGLYNGINARTWSVQASTSNISNYIVARDTKGDIFVSNVNAIEYHGDGGTLSNIVGSQNLQQVIVENPYTNSPPYFGAGSYGAIYGSNTISASTISASSLVSPHFVGSAIYGVIVGQNTVSASTITTTDTISAPRVSATSYVSGGTVISSSSGGIYGPIKGSNTITTSAVYGPIYGSNTISASTISTTTGFYGPIKGSNTISASTISTTTGFYGPIKGSNTITGTTLNVDDLVSDDASAINRLNASNINSGVLSNAYGGTGFTSYSQGDLLVGVGSGSDLKKLGIGSSGQVLTVSGGTVSWQPGSGNISLDQVVEVSNSTSNVVQFTGADYDTSFVTSKKVGIANTAPTHTLDVGEVFSIVNTTSGGDVLILRGNAYFNDELYIAKKLTVPASGEIVADTIKCRSLSTKGTIVVNERRESIVRID